MFFSLQRGDLVTVPPQELIGQQPGNFKKNYKKVGTGVIVVNKDSEPFECRVQC